MCKVESPSYLEAFPEAKVQHKEFETTNLSLSIIHNTNIKHQIENNWCTEDQLF